MTPFGWLVSQPASSAFLSYQISISHQSTSHQPAVLFSHIKSAPATNYSQLNRVNCNPISNVTRSSRHIASYNKFPIALHNLDISSLNILLVVSLRGQELQFHYLKKGLTVRNRENGSALYSCKGTTYSSTARLNLFFQKI